MIRWKFQKNIYVIQRGLLTNDNEIQILAINDYLFELEFDREEEMRTEKPAVDLTQNIIVKKKELSLYALMRALSICKDFFI